MTSALPVHIALVDESGRIDPSTLQQYAGALGETILRDVHPVWHVNATVGAYKTVPPHTWAVKIQKVLDQPGALGYHTDDGNQPYALVEYTDTWDVTVSHEVDEMLVDPWGSRMHSGRLPTGLELDFAQFGLRSAKTHVRYLLESCDPPESDAFAYESGAFRFSDFLLPAWYSNLSAGRFSFNGGCQRAREVADGGYVSFANSVGEWFQAYNQGGSLTVQDLGKFNRGAAASSEANAPKAYSLREFTDYHARQFRASLPPTEGETR